MAEDFHKETTPLASQLEHNSPIGTAVHSEVGDDLGEDVNANELDQLVFNLVELVTASDPEGL